MALFSFEGREPVLGRDIYVADSAEVIGDVRIGDRCYIGPGAKIRGDYGRVEIGGGTAVEENCVIHARPDEVCSIGERVTVGHGAVIHNATISDDAVIGMAAVVSDYAEVGRWCFVGEGCVVKSKQVLPDETVAVGIPAKVVGRVTDEQKEFWRWGKDLYADLARRYRKGLKRLD